jgi:hypothetical protein
MAKGKREEAVYHKPEEELLEEEEETVEEDLEDDEIEPWEEGFEQGEKQGGQLGKDALTGQAITDPTLVVELEWGGRIYRFANQKNADLFLKKKEDEANVKKVSVVKHKSVLLKKVVKKVKKVKNAPRKKKVKKVSNKKLTKKKKK